eukprot:scaffold3.g6611.t1
MQLHHGSAQLSAACPLLRGSARSTRHASPAPHSGRHGRRGARPRAFRPVRAAAGGGGSGDARASLYPAGQRQARLRLPALLLFVTADALLDEEAVREELAAAVSAGATAVVLAEGADAGGGAARLYDAALALKELLRSRAALMIRDRTDIAEAVGADGVLLSPGGLPTVVAKRMLAGGLGLVGRVVGEPAAAAAAAAEGASFVVLEGGGGRAPPTPAAAAAARQQQRSSASIPVIALAPAAASSEELATLVVAGVDGLAMDTADLTPVASALRQRPQSSTAMAAASLLHMLGATADVMMASFDGGDASVSSIDIDEALFGEPQDEDTVWSMAAAEMAAAGAAAAAGLMPAPGPARAARRAPAAQLSQLLSASREALVEAERGLLTDLLGFLSEACPELEEAVLVQDALRQLDELFLLVVVGEFNSGKSAVVNALLGQRYLAEGILPTTNEICVLKWGETDEASYSDAGGVQDSEGVFTRKLPAELLREVNVVDTPGTNVILERQQRLTEEYVPRADLVLFVLSADRPFTDSEVRFLKYVRQWGKKVVFVVNKVDLLSSEAEVDEVVGFVRENAGRLLDVRDARVLPISARAAMEAKLACRGVAASERPRFWPAGADGDSTDSDLEPLHASTSTSGGVLTPEQAAVLAADPNWQRSRFESLEHFIYQFLVRGSPGTAVASLNFSSDDEEIGAEAGSGAPLATGESVRLKLQTPLFMAEALIDQAGRAVGAELEAARENLGNLRLVRTQLMHFKKEMGKEGRLQREEVSKLVKAGVQRNGRAVDATLKLSNWEVLLNYLLNGSKDGTVKPGPVARRMRAEGGGEEAAGVRSLVREHTSWLESNCQRQVANYRSFVDQRVAALGYSMPALLRDASTGALSSSGGDDGGREAAVAAGGGGREARAAEPAALTAAGAPAPEAALLGELDSDAEARRRWRELRQAAAAAAADAADYSSWRRGARRGEEEGDESALAATGALDPRRTELLLEEEVREAVLSTVGTAGGAGLFGLVLTWVLPTTLEDLLALGLAAMVGYMSVLSLPLRRGEAKRKLEALAASYAEDIQAKMEAELGGALDACEFEVLGLIAPLEKLGADAVALAEGHEARRRQLSQRLDILKQRVANVE